MWRSLVAHLHGVQGVEGSNPFTPTIFTEQIHSHGQNVEDDEFHAVERDLVIGEIQDKHTCRIGDVNMKEARLYPYSYRFSDA